MRTVVIIAMGLLINLAALAGPPVCDRSEPIREALERVFNVPCNEIEVTDLQQVKYLNAYSEAQRSLRAGDLEDFHNLSTLNLRGYDFVPEITPEVLEDYLRPAKDLEELTLVLKTPSLPLGMFSGLDKLKVVSLELRDTASIPSTIFDDLASIHRLLLKLSPTSEITQRHLEKLVLLNHFSAEVHTLEVSAETFKFNPRLQFLEIRNLGGMEFVDQSISKMPDLKHLYLAGLQKPLPVGFLKGANRLLSFMIRESGVYSLPLGFLDACEALDGVFFTSTDLGSLPAEIFRGNPHLTSLLVSDSPATVITKAHLKGLKKLKDLYLRSVGIDLTNDFLEETPALTYIEFRSANLTSIPNQLFLSAPKVTSIFIGENALGAFRLSELDFTGLTQLTSVVVAGAMIPDAEIQAARLKWPSIRFDF